MFKFLKLPWFKFPWTKRREEEERLTKEARLAWIAEEDRKWNKKMEERIGVEGRRKEREARAGSNKPQQLPHPSNLFTDRKVDRGVGSPIDTATVVAMSDWSSSCSSDSSSSDSTSGCGGASSD